MSNEANKKKRQRELVKFVREAASQSRSKGGKAAKAYVEEHPDVTIEDIAEAMKVVVRDEKAALMAVVCAARSKKTRQDYVNTNSVVEEPMSIVELLLLLKVLCTPQDPAPNEIQVTTLDDILKLINRRTNTIAVHNSKLTRETALLRGLYIYHSRKEGVDWKTIAKALGSKSNTPCSSSALQHPLTLYQLIADHGMHKLRHLRIEGDILQRLYAAKSALILYLKQHRDQLQWWQPEGENPTPHTTFGIDPRWFL